MGSGQVGLGNSQGKVGTVRDVRHTCNRLVRAQAEKRGKRLPPNPAEPKKKGKTCLSYEQSGRKKRERTEGIKVEYPCLKKSKGPKPA